MLRAVSQPETDKYCTVSLLCEILKKKKKTRTHTKTSEFLETAEKWLPGAVCVCGGGVATGRRNRERLVKGYKFSATRAIRAEDLTSNAMTIPDDPGSRH